MSDYNAPMTVGKLKAILRDLPDGAAVMVKNDQCVPTPNIDYWFEDTGTRVYLELEGKKLYKNMVPEELEKIYE